MVDLADEYAVQQSREFDGKMLKSIASSADEVTTLFIEPSSMFAKCDPCYGDYMASGTTYRCGVVPKDVNDEVTAIGHNNSSFAASLRVDGAIGVGVTEFQANVMPYPRIHITLASHAPDSSVGTAYRGQFSDVEATMLVFEPTSMFEERDPCYGKYRVRERMYL